MYLTGGIPPQPMVYRCSVDEEWRIQLPVEVRQALNVRPEHRGGPDSQGEQGGDGPRLALLPAVRGRGEAAPPPPERLPVRALPEAAPGTGAGPPAAPAGGRGSVGGLRRLGKKITKQVFFL